MPESLGENGAGVVFLAEFDFRKALGQDSDKGELRGTGGGEVTVFGGEGALLVVHALDQLWYNKIGVGIALAVGVGAGVHRHAVDRDGEVGAVVEVEAA